MTTSIFVNVPTDDLERAKTYYTSLGAEINPHFTDDNAACLAWSDTVFFMVLKRDFFATFTDKTVGDPKTTATALISLSRESREDVDKTIEAGVANGGTSSGEPQDYGFMYSRDLEDPDGNGVQFLWMDPVAAQNGPEAYLAEHASA